ncbi:Ribokinase-like protein [Naematelia encephala]|uniref:Ribokinase-like protein n=1 Tax=Naematelia encephala TaxID=71784 RepID=A0A1Y2AQ14_9TREE|nr:Ribokinase-like protein [Naematelia encephala]
MTMSTGRIVTLEQFIIDTFTQIDENGVETPSDIPDQIGGGGTYMIIGSRMFLPPERLGMIVHHGSEPLPKPMQDKLDSYGPEIWVSQKSKHTCLGLNRYRGDHRSFQYLTEPVLLTPKHIFNTPLENPLPTTLHVISYPPRIEQVLAEIHEIKSWSPRIVWEPDAEPLEVVQRVSGSIDIISPNHTELFHFLDLPTTSSSDNLRESVESALKLFLAGLAQPPKTAVIVRASYLGVCYVTTPHISIPVSSPSTPATSSSSVAPLLASGHDIRWVPAYWQVGMEGYKDKVVDPTGCGNAFMGGLAAAFEKNENIDVETAIIWGTVSASYTIEQLGPPVLEVCQDGTELWNGEDPMNRVESLRRRLVEVN